MASLALGNCGTQLKTIKTSGGLAPEKRHRSLLVPSTFMLLQPPTSFDCFNHKVLLKSVEICTWPGTWEKIHENSHVLHPKLSSDLPIQKTMIFCIWLLVITRGYRLPIISARFLAFHQKTRSFYSFSMPFSMNNSEIFVEPPPFKPVIQVWDSTSWAEAAKLKSGRRAEPKESKRRCVNAGATVAMSRETWWFFNGFDQENIGNFMHQTCLMVVFFQCKS